MAKKRKCMEQGGAVYPQERPVKPVQEPEWKQTLGKVWDAIKGNTQQNPNPPPTANTLADTASAIVNRKVDNLDAMKRAGYAVGGLAGNVFSDRPDQQAFQSPVAAAQVGSFLGGVQDAMPTSMTPTSTTSTQQAIGAVQSPNELPGGTVLDRMNAAKKVALDNGMSSQAYDASLIKSPTPMGNVFSSGAANMGNVFSASPSTGMSSMTMAEKDKAMGLDPNRAYRPGAADDPHGANTAYSNILRNAPAPELPPSNPVPNVDLPQFVSRRQRQKGFAEGGMTMFKGKGGPREDQIPVTVAGDKINVSNGEAGLILPAKTAKSPQALSQIAQTIAQSNDGRMPKMGIEAGGKYQGGAMDRYPYDGKDPLTAQDLYAPVSGIGGMARAAFPATAAAIDEGGANMRKAYNEGNYGAVLGNAGREVVSGGLGLVDDVSSSAARLLDFPANALKTLATGDSTPAMQRQPGLSQVAKTTISSAAADRAIGVPPSQLNPQNQILKQSIGNAGNAYVNPKTGNLHFTQPGFDPTKESFADGTGAISNKAGKTIVVTPGNYTAADGTQTSDWYKTQAYADAIKRNDADKAWLARMQSERQGRDPVQSLATQQGMALAAQEAPMKQQLAQQQIAQGAMTAQQAQELQAARNAITNAKTPADQEMAIRIFRALNPKSDDKRFIPQTAKTYDNGMPTGEEVRMFDTNTQKWLSPNDAAQKSSAPPKAAIDALKVNKTPQMIEAFNAKYGNGAAQQILGK